MPKQPAPLTGLAVGDALGAPFESIPSTFAKSMQRIAEWDGKSFLPAAFHKTAPGQWTDDTQMSLALADTILVGFGYDPVAVAQAYLRWFESPDCRGIGTATKLAMGKLKQGVPWYRCATLGAQGNGPAMRAAPLGMAATSIDVATGTARIDADLTHRHLEAEEGSAAVASAVWWLTRGRLDTKPDLLNLVIQSLRESRLRDELQDLDRLLKVGVTRNEFIARKRWDETGAPGHTVTTVTAALLCFATSRDYQDAVVSAIKIGGDADTTAAITGALAGAFYGYDGIPEEYRAGVEAADRIRTTEVALLAL